MEVVAFKDGTFGVRKIALDVGLFRSTSHFQFNQCTSSTSWWSLGNCAEHVRFSTREEAEARVQLLTDEGTPVGK